MTAKTSYISIANAQVYFDGILNTDPWDDADETDQGKALVEASTAIDRMQYVGLKANAQQEHEFPRSIVLPEVDECVYDTDNIPLDVKYAVCEQALALLDGWNTNQEIDNLRMIADGYADVKSQYVNTVPMHTKMGICAKAWQLIVPFIRDPRALALMRA